MSIADRDQQTICAVSTPAGYGGIAVIRVSGPKAYEFVRKIGPKLPHKPESHRVYLATLFDEQNNPIDETLITFFQNGKSFTGEEVVEISCHGNPSICESILSQLVRLGAYSANRGEFTYRAFMNNRLDLIQAESVLSLIESQSNQARSLALRQLKGQLSETIHKVEDQLTWCLAHLEASIDFSNEDLEIISQKKLIETLSEIKKNLLELVSGYKQGRLIKDGVRVALVGRPNVGKSSLLNFLCGEDKAIVTSLAGTTRDLIESDLLFNGHKFSFIDTAGLRTNYSDEVEKIGIQKSRNIMNEADLLIFVFDLSTGIQTQDLSELEPLKSKNVLILGNKADLVKNPEAVLAEEMQKIQSQTSIQNAECRAVSSLKQSDKPLILNDIFKFSKLKQAEVGALISQVRHFEGLNKALECVIEAETELSKNLGAELLAIHLKEALLSTQEVLGKHYDDQVLDRVFKEFCLGK